MIYINQAFSDFLKIPIEEMVGKLVTDINSTSMFLQTLETRKADIAVRHKFPTGSEAICHRIPLFDSFGELVGGMGMILFEEVAEMEKLLNHCRQLDAKIKLYQHEIARLNRAKYSLNDFIGQSLPAQKVRKLVKKAARVNTNVLITGESGVGKEIIAQAIHVESLRNDMPFVSINCSAIPENLLESELFGYDEGSFTGAKKGGNMGKFELANKGTLFLDEIGDMPYSMQAKLLRALQEKEVYRVGGKYPVLVDIRIVAATHKNLLEMVENGEFREDLYYRLNILQIDIPPLRERIDDVKLLLDDFIIRFYKEYGFLRKVPASILKIMKNYDWPGNVRELKNVVEKMCVNAEDTMVRIYDVPQNLLHAVETRDRKKSLGLKEIVGNFEKKIILSALESCGGNISKTARELDIPRMSLYRKLKEYKIGISE